MWVNWWCIHYSFGLVLLPCNGLSIWSYSRRIDRTAVREYDTHYVSCAFIGLLKDLSFLCRMQQMLCIDNEHSNFDSTAIPQLPELLMGLSHQGVASLKQIFELEETPFILQPVIAAPVLIQVMLIPRTSRKLSWANFYEECSVYKIACVWSYCIICGVKPRQLHHLSELRQKTNMSSGTHFSQFDS